MVSQLYDLKAMLPEELARLVGELDEPAYRTRQIFDWLYAKGVRDIQEMTNISKILREKLAERTRITCLSLVSRQESATGEAVKFLFELPSGHRVESVLIVRWHPAHGLSVVASGLSARLQILRHRADGDDRQPRSRANRRSTLAGEPVRPRSGRAG